jgi:hypothetical protein
MFYVRPIEERNWEFGPFVANTHTETTVSVWQMTKAYHHPEVLQKSMCDDDAHWWNRMTV